MKNHVHGERHPRAKLTEADVAHIRAMRSAGAKLELIQACFPLVALSQIVSAVNRKTWKHVPWWREWTDVYGEGWKA